MKKLKVFGIIAFIAVMGFSLVGCVNPAHADVTIRNNHVYPIVYARARTNVGGADQGSHITIAPGRSYTFTAGLNGVTRDATVTVRYRTPDGHSTTANQIFLRMSPGQRYQFTLNPDGRLVQTR